MEKKVTVTVKALIGASIDKVWDYYTKPEYVVQWNYASADWHTPQAENDLQIGGKFKYRMESKDKKRGFDFGGTYNELIEHQLIVYTMGDGRRVEVNFSVIPGSAITTSIEVTFEVEAENTIDAQKAGWQAILDNFKLFTETH